MRKKAMAILLALMMFVSTGCGRESNETETTTAAEKVAVDEVAAEETIETQEVEVPGVVDSVFGDDFVPEVSQTVPETTVSEPVKEVQPEAQGEMDYDTFRQMTPSQQRAYEESFGDIDAFFDWYDAAKEAYDKEHQAIEIIDGVVDLSKIAG